MIEIENRYKIYEKRFGYINWIGFWTLYKKEVLSLIPVGKWKMKIEQVDWDA